MGSCNSTKNGVENEYEYGHDHLVILGKHASQPYGSNGLVTEASTCMETSQQG